MRSSYPPETIIYPCAICGHESKWYCVPTVKVGHGLTKELWTRRLWVCSRVGHASKVEERLRNEFGNELVKVAFHKLEK